MYGDFKVVHQIVNMSCMQLRKNVLRDVNTRRDEIRFRSFNTKAEDILKMFAVTDECCSEVIERRECLCLGE